MSHIEKRDILVRDIPTLTAAVKELGGELVQATTFFSYYDNHPCQYKIRVPGCSFEIGVREEEGVDQDILKATGKSVVTKRFGLHCDFYGDGAKLAKAFGDNLSKIKPTYAIHAAINAAKKKGLMVNREKLKNGTTKLTITGSALNH